ncbi:MAG: carboxylate--amine ligase [Calditrichaeota bacterium]|nr:MAG: carboxylate--amine ligase [Calditrichota bacterium]
MSPNSKNSKNVRTSSANPPALVIGLDCLQGLSTARILSGYKIPVIGIAKNPDYHCCKTNSCQEILFADTAGEELITLLEKIGPQFDSKPVIFPCQDKNVLNISRNRERLEQWYHILMPAHEIIESLLDKVLFYELAQQKGLPVPKTFILKSREDAENAAGKMSYPCLLKPPWRPESWTKHTKVKALKANSKQEFLSLYDHYHKWIDILLVQNWIEGPNENHFTCNCYFDKNSEPLVTFTSRKLRQWLPKTGQACLAEEFRNDRVVAETHRLFKQFKFWGLGYLEMKRDENTGENLIIEPNVGRPTGRSSMAEAGGVDFLYTMYCHALNMPLPKNRTQNFSGRKWIHELRDTQAAIHHLRRGELSIWQWLTSVRGRKSYALFSIRDLVPFFTAIKNALPALLSKKEQGGEDYKSS